MKNYIRYIAGLSIAAALWCMQSCSETAEPVGPDESAHQKVRVELFVRSSDYELPASRADESLFEFNPMVIVFTGQGNDAVFSEAEKAVHENGASTVMLTYNPVAVTLLVVANMPQNKFFNGTAEVDFTAANIHAAFTEKTLAEVKEQLKTVSLPSGILSSLPFSSPTDRLPMSALRKLPGINSDITIGTTGSPLMLERAMAKVTVEVDSLLNPAFKLIAVGVSDASRSGKAYSGGDTPVNNTGNATRYGNDSGGMANAASDITGLYSTNNEPVYLYEASADQGTALIIKAEVGNEIRYYKVPFYDGEYLEIRRNKYYRFRIISVGSGYSTMDHAVASAGLPDFQYVVTVSDAVTYDIVSDEDIYIGTDFSFIDTYIQTSHKVALNVYTDATSSDVTFTSVAADNGLAVSPESITLATTPVNPGRTEMEITIPQNFQSGVVLIRVGTLKKEILVTRYNDAIVSGRPLELPHDDYTWGASSEPTWLFVSSNGSVVYTELEKDAPGKMYAVAHSSSTGSATGIVSAFRNTVGRTRIYIPRP